MINKFTVALFILTCIHCVYAQPLKYKGYPSREGKLILEVILNHQ